MEITRIGVEGEPEFTEDIMSLQWLQDIKKMHKEKFLSAFAKFMHFMFKRGTLYYDYPEKERIALIDKEVLGEVKSERFLQDGNCLMFYTRVKNASLSEPEKFFEKTKEALNELSEKIRHIPMEKEGYYDQEVPSQDGQATVKVKVKVMIDNSQEFLKSMKMSEDIFDYQDKLRKRIAEQQKSEKRQKKDPSMRLFDQE
jgi:hypothetical protein